MGTNRHLEFYHLGCCLLPSITKTLLKSETVFKCSIFEAAAYPLN